MRIPLALNVAGGLPKPLATLLPVLLIALALAVAAVLAHRVWRDVKGESDEPSTDPDELLGPLTEAYTSGQMSAEEYERIRRSMTRAGYADPRYALPVRPARPPAPPQPGGAGPVDPAGEGEPPPGAGPTADG